MQATTRLSNFPNRFSSSTFMAISFGRTVCHCFVFMSFTFCRWAYSIGDLLEQNLFRYPRMGTVSNWRGYWNGISATDPALHET